MFDFVVQYCIYVVQKPYICTTKLRKECNLLEMSVG